MIEEIIKYCRDDDYNERGGVILNGKFIPLINVSNNPQDQFSFAYYGDFDAIVHSHPGGPFYPSEADMMQQIATDCPWFICAFDDERTEVFQFGDGSPVSPLIGRGYRFGVTDCYSLCRDFYKVNANIILPEYPREWEFWNKGIDLYTPGFMEAGFNVIDLAEIDIGDAILFSIRSKVPNHACIYLGDGVMMHHTSPRVAYDPSRLSTLDHVERWQPFIHRVVRHAEKNRINRQACKEIRKSFLL